MGLTKISQIENLQNILNLKLEGNSLADQIIPNWNSNNGKLDNSILKYLRTQGIIEVQGNLMIDGQFYTDGVTRITPSANAASISVDLNQGNVIEIDLNNYTNTSIQPTINFTNAKDSAKYIIKIIQSNVNTQINWTASLIHFSKDALLKLSPTNDAIDIFEFLYDTNKFYGELFWSSDRFADSAVKYPILSKTGVETTAGIYIESKNVGSNGRLTIYPTSDGTATGTPYFSQIISATALPFRNETNSYDAALGSGHQIVSAHEVVFSIVSGTNPVIPALNTNISTINYVTDTTVMVYVEITGKLTDFGLNLIGNSDLIRGIDGITPVVEDNGDGTYSITDGFGTEVTWRDGLTSSNYPVFTTSGLQALTGAYAEHVTINNGKHTFYATIGGTSTGAALFDEIFSIDAFVVCDAGAGTTSPELVKLAGGNAVINNKQIDVNIVSGRVLVISGLNQSITTTSYNTTNNVTVYIKVLGKLSQAALDQLQNFEPLRGPAGFSPIVARVTGGATITDENGAITNVYDGFSPTLQGNQNGSITFTDHDGNQAVLVPGTSPTITPNQNGYVITDAFGNTKSVSNGIDGFSPIVTPISNGVTITDKNSNVYAITDGDDGISPDITVTSNGYTITDFQGTTATISNGQTGPTYPIFTNTGLKTTVGMYVQNKLNTATGRTIFYATSDGTSTGTALFTTIHSVAIVPVLTTTSAVAAPLSSGYEIRTNKEVEVSLITGRNLLALGNTTAFATDTTIRIYVTVVGDLSAFGQTQVTANSGLRGPAGQSAVVNNNFDGSFTLTDGLGNTVTWYDGATLLNNRQVEITLTESATITWNMGNNINAKVGLTASRNLSITNPKNGDRGKLRIVQSGAGGYSLTLPGSSKIQGISGNILTLGSGSQYIIDYYYDGTTYYWYTPVQF